MTQEQAIAEITRRLVDYYHPEPSLCSARPPAVTAARTAISISVWSCLTMRPRVSTGQAYTGPYGTWARLRMGSDGHRPTSKHAWPM